MTTESTDPITVAVSAPGAPVPPAEPARPAADPESQPSEPAPDATPGSVSDLSAMTPAQLDDLADRIRTARESRPPSIADVLSKLQTELTATHTAKQEAVAERKDAGATADRLEESIAEIKRTLRRTELAEAATAAGFVAPTVVADHLLSADPNADVASLITNLAKTGAFAMRQPATSAQVGGASSAGAPQLDPGMAALVAEINAAHGR